MPEASASANREIALFGATGRTGRLVLDQALAAGYSVRALARRPEAIAATSDRLVVVQGDVLDPAAVENTVRGTDAVISVFGQVKGSPASLQTRGTELIVEAMQREGLTRVITLSGGGLPAEEHDQPKAADRVIRFLLRKLAPQVLDDAIGHLEVLKKSGLDWTVVRGPRLTDAAAAGTYRVGWVGVNASTQIARGDLASFILTQLDDRTFVHELPFVSR